MILIPNISGEDIAMSATGSLIVIAFESFLLVSNDFGATLKQDVKNSDPLFRDRNFMDVSMSNDGSKIVLNTYCNITE